MSDSEQELLTAWLEAAGADGQDIKHRAREHKKFLRTLNEVKTEAWAHGYWDGWMDNMTGCLFDTANPYKEEEPND